MATPPPSRPGLYKMTPQEKLLRTTKQSLELRRIHMDRLAAYIRFMCDVRRDALVWATDNAVLALASMMRLPDPEPGE